MKHICENICKKVICLLFILSIIVSCTEKRFENETNLFKQFLKSNFNLKIENSTSKYIIISRFSCESCVNNYLINLKNEEKSKMIFIIPIHYNIKKHISFEPNMILVDTNDNSSLYEFCSGGITEVSTKNKEILEIKNIRD